MLKVEVKKGNIERALKQLKGKFIKTKEKKLKLRTYKKNMIEKIKIL
jgi:hypothetical protein